MMDWLDLGFLHFEKCELQEAHDCFLQAFQDSKKENDPRVSLEALVGLLKVSEEALNDDAIRKWERELEEVVGRTAPGGQLAPQESAYSRQLPSALFWFCEGMISQHRGQRLPAQRRFHRFLRTVSVDREAGSELEMDPHLAVWMARAWIAIAYLFQQRNHLRAQLRAQWIANEMIKRYESKNLKGINGALYMLQGTLSETRQEFKPAVRWFQKAQAQFLAERNWYDYLYSLFGSMRVARQLQNYAQAYWYLDLADKAAVAPPFAKLRREVAAERSRLEQDAVDLLIDSRKGVVRTRESGHVYLRKQYVLLHILAALTEAHRRSGDDLERGLSKAEIIEHVWKETYRPEVHDNKLYYNINRLRKLIEPDVRRPQYLLNWKEGYRLAPGLKIQFL